ncbi:MAG: hypothetical protein WA063_00440 [Minisyncoccia bacterium]
MTNNNALVCLEELNYGFKRGRIRIEKSIYQNLENDLVNKLNYLVLKKSSQGVRNALQLTPRNNAQKYWGNQMGAIFYTDAKFTSRTCPNCGFRKRGVSDFDQVENLKTKIDNGDIKMFFEKENDRFRVEYNWKYEFNENNSKKEFDNSNLYGENIMEFVYSDVQRAVWNNGRYTSEIRNPNEELKKLFGDFLTSEENLFKLIREKSRFSYSNYIQIFKSILEIRNTIDKKDIISCPKCHFSTLSDKMQKIKDGDANGAYNIARRGLLIFKKIRSDKLIKKTKTKKGIESKDLKIILKEWDEQTYQQWDKKDWLKTENKRGL